MFGMGTGVSLAPWAPSDANAFEGQPRFSFNAASGINPDPHYVRTAATTFPFGKISASSETMQSTDFVTDVTLLK